ncbi:hypothetical protein AVEN_247585-1 [Araneus ventricosus]|uniref:Uncharacterized protein n=1 Tax=Araneus ventricosus TaxID=182803 RepID=A0A4Y2D7P6_ARAVE|nr:hypothetical protein AVEN_247585-1 [Araneus ventricosus]
MNSFIVEYELVYLWDDGLEKEAKLNVELVKQDLHLQRKGWRDEDAVWTVEVWLVLNSLIAGGRGYSVTEVAICENVGQDCGNGTIALDSTEKTIEGKKKTINWDLDGKDWFLFGESGANYGSSFLTLNCWLRCGTILADVVGWLVPYSRRL